MRYARSLSLDALVDSGEFLTAGRLRMVRPRSVAVRKARAGESKSGGPSSDPVEEAKRLRDEWRNRRYSA